MRLPKAISLLPFLFLLGACGKWAKTQKESVNTLPIPSYPQIEDDVFTLNSKKTKTEYKGTLLFFNDETQPELIANIINASVASRGAWGEMKKFETETDYVRKYADGGTTFRTLELMREGLQAFELIALEKSPISFEAKKENARTWLSREIESLGLTAEQREAFDKVWGAYCEAKVIEFSTHPASAQNGFKSLPLPSALCQDYYSQQNYFSDASCQSPANGDYTKCLWVDGVLRTRWFTVPSTNADLAQKREDKRNRLLALVNDANYNGTRGVLSFQTNAFVPNLSTAFKKLYFDKKEAFVSIALDQKNDNTCTKVIANPGSQDLCRIFGLAPEALSPRQIISVVEGVTVDEKILARLPLPTSRSSVSTQQILRYLGERNRAETSEGDRLFMELNDGSTLPQPSFSAAGKEFNTLLPNLRAELAAEFYGSLSEADQRRKREKLEAIAFLEDELTSNRKRWTELNDTITASTENGIAAANAGDVAVGFVQYQMAFEQKNDILMVQFWLQEAREHVFTACLDLITNQQLACPEGFSLRTDASFYAAKIKRATDGSRIDFEITVDDPLAQGFGPKARAEDGRKPDFFMDLQAEAWQDRTLRLELYRNRIKNYLDIMTGKAFIEKEGQREYEGGISSWEQAD